MLRGYARYRKYNTTAATDKAINIPRPHIATTNVNDIIKSLLLAGNKKGPIVSQDEGARGATWIRTDIFHINTSKNALTGIPGLPYTDVFGRQLQNGIQIQVSLVRSSHQLSQLTTNPTLLYHS